MIACKIRIQITLLLVWCSFAAFSQNNSIAIEHSPDRKFALWVTSSSGGDANMEWKYWLINVGRDTTLLTQTITHDQARPVTYWTKTSRLIFEEQNENGQRNRIKVLDPKSRSVDFEFDGFISGYGKCNFDHEHNILFYLKGEAKSFDLMSLEIDGKKNKKLDSFVTSGDPITGSPAVESINMESRKLVIQFEEPGGKPATRIIEY